MDVALHQQAELWASTWIHTLIFAPVSYTHLDVYKRQPKRNEATATAMPIT